MRANNGRFVLTTLQSPASGHDVQSPPLAGLRVLDFTHILAGPFCTRILADLGAEVLRVETRSRPDRMGASVNQSGAAGGDDGRHPHTHRNKKSITLDLKREGGRAVCTRLASVADVLVENFSAGVMRRLHLDYADLAPLNPRLIYVSMSGYGHSGPRRDWTSMNMNLQAYTGLMMVTGREGDLPMAISNSWNDFIGGLHAGIGILQALAERNRTGRGANLDLAQFECSVATVGPLLLSSIVNGRAPARLGNRSPHAAPQGCYPCAGDDEWCVISVQTDEQWRALAQAMGSPDWAADPRYATVLGRLHHHDELDERIVDWTRQLPKEELERILQAAGVPVERMRRVNEVVDPPEAGHVFRPLANSAGPGVQVAGLPFTLQKSATCAPTPPAALGEHTGSALTDWLGLTEAEIQALESEGALV
jgi:crotonobetainyl-CoA:carnitine CoA-transferase CaiB-like acyl-CoA transferase